MWNEKDRDSRDSWPVGPVPWAALLAQSDHMCFMKRYRTSAVYTEH